MKKFFLFLLTIFMAYYTAYLSKPEKVDKGFWDFLSIPPKTKLSQRNNSEKKGVLDQIFGKKEETPIKIFFSSKFDSAYYQEAKKKFRQKDYPTSFVLFYRTWSSGNKFDSLAFYLSRSAYEMDSNKLALKWIDSAVTLNKNNYESLSFQAKLYNLSQKSQQAYEAAESALSIAGIDYLPAIVQKAYASYYINSDFEETKSLINRALNIDSTNSDTWYIQGLIAEYENNTQDALTKFHKIIARDTNFTKAYAEIGYLLMDSAYQKSISYYKIALNKPHPKKYIYFLNIGLLYSRLDKIDSCMYFYAKCIQVKPDYYLVYNNRGYQYYLAKEYKKAIKDYSKCIDLKPDYLTAHLYRGIIYYDQEDYVQALNDFYSAHESNPDDEYAIYDIGLAQDALGNYQDAIDMFEKYLSVGTDAPNLTYVHKRVSLLKKKLNE